MTYLTTLENNSIYIIREAYHRFKKTALLWSMGKDSTVLLWLCRKAFLGDVPFDVLHIDTSYKFKEIYAFRDVYTKKWNLNLHIIKNDSALQKGTSPKIGKFECCHSLKTEALKNFIIQKNFSGLLLGIRRDEHGIRTKERFFSPRDINFSWDYKNQPFEPWNIFSSKKTQNNHFRIHPLLAWREIDVWHYIQKEKIPTIGLYFSKKHMRYRSIGCESCCRPIPSEATTTAKIIAELDATSIAERSGRAQDKEDSYTMQKLRSLGYM